MTMSVAIGTFELHFPFVHSLKEKRQILRCIIDRVKSKYNVSIAEVDLHDLWQRGVIGIAIVSNDRTYLQHVGQKIEELVLNNQDVNLADKTWEII